MLPRLARTTTDNYESDEEEEMPEKKPEEEEMEEKQKKKKQTTKETPAKSHDNEADKGEVKTSYRLCSRNMDIE